MANLSGEAGGRGIHGNGQYFAQLTETGVRMGAEFSDPLGHIYVARLADDAMIIQMQDLHVLHRAIREHPDILESTKRWIEKDDLARTALLAKIDAIRISPSYTDGKADEFIVLNRSKVIVDKRSLPGGSLYEGIPTMEEAAVRVEQMTNELRNYKDSLEQATGAERENLKQVISTIGYEIVKWKRFADGKWDKLIQKRIMEQYK